MTSLKLRQARLFLILSFLSLSFSFLACQDDSGPAVGSPGAHTASDSGIPKGDLGGSCEGFDVLRTPIKSSLKAMPCAQGCPDHYEPVCTADGLTYPNACYAELAKATVEHTGVCR